MRWFVASTVAVVGLAACGSSDEGGTGGGTSGQGAEAGSPAPPLALSPGDVVWIDTGEIEHTKDYYGFEGKLAPEVPTDWTSPVAYASGRYTLRVEVVSLSNPAAQPIFYTVGWKRAVETPQTDDAEYIRTAVKIDRGVGVYEQEGEIKKLSKVIGGKDSGPIGDDWDWSNAWRRPNGDAFDIGPEQPYPLRVRVTFVLHPPG